MSLLTLKIAHLFIFLCRARQQKVRGNFAELFEEGLEIVNDFLGKGKSGSGTLSDSSRLSSLSQKVNLRMSAPGYYSWYFGASLFVRRVENGNLVIRKSG
jgi:hypothetical protein